MREVAANVDGQRVIALLRDLIRIPSPTGQEQQIGAFIAEYMRSAGFDEVQIDDNANVLGTVRGSGDGPTLMFLTHTDSSPAGQMEHPFSAEEMDGESFGVAGRVIYGRGAAAPKCAIAAYVEGVRTVIESGRQNLNGTIQVACVTKDMGANHEGVKEIEQSIGINADYVVSGEPSNNQVVMGARGISHIQVTLNGKPTHWGRPKEGVNPLYGLADVLKRVEQLELPSHPILGPATVSPFDASAESAPPLTPHTVEAMFDRRVLPGETPDEVVAPFQAIVEQVCADRPGLSGQAKQVRGMFSFQVPEDSPVRAAVLDAGRAVTGRDIGTTYIPFGSNAGYTIQALSIPGVAFAPGRIIDVGDREHVEVDQVIEGARIAAAICIRMLG